MNSNDTKRSSEELRKDVLLQLDKVDTDLDQMQTRMTPGQFLDDAIFYPNGSNPAAVFDHLKNNPVGTTFLALGTLLLMEDETHMTYEQIARTRVTSAVDQSRQGIDHLRTRVSDTKRDASEMVSNAKSKISSVVGGSQDKLADAKAQIGKALDKSKDKIDAVMENLKSSVGSDDSSTGDFNTEFSGSNQVGFEGYANDYESGEDFQRNQAIDDAKVAFGSIDTDSSSSNGGGIKDQVSEKLNTASERMNSIKSDVGSRVSSAKDQVSSKVSGAISSARDQIDIGAAKDAIKSRTQDGVRAVKSLDPLTYVAIGAGLGALTGAALPVSEAERNFVDGKLEDSISSFTQELEDALSESSSILKDLVMSDLKSINVGDFLNR